MATDPISFTRRSLFATGGMLVSSFVLPAIPDQPGKYRLAGATEAAAEDKTETFTVDVASEWTVQFKVFDVAEAGFDANSPGVAGASITVKPLDVDLPSTTVVTDDRGFALVEINGYCAEVAEDAPRYECTAQIDIRLDGHRQVRILKMRLLGTRLYALPLPHIEEGKENEPYFRAIALNGWDVEYTDSTFLYSITYEKVYPLTAQVYIPTDIQIGSFVEFWRWHTADPEKDAFPGFEEKTGSMGLLGKVKIGHEHSENLYGTTGNPDDRCMWAFTLEGPFLREKHNRAFASENDHLVVRLVTGDNKERRYTTYASFAKAPTNICQSGNIGLTPWSTDGEGSWTWELPEWIPGTNHTINVGLLLPKYDFIYGVYYAPSYPYIWGGRLGYGWVQRRYKKGTGNPFATEAQPTQSWDDAVNARMKLFGDRFHEAAQALGPDNWASKGEQKLPSSMTREDRPDDDGEIQQTKARFWNCYVIWGLQVYGEFAYNEAYEALDGSLNAILFLNIFTSFNYPFALGPVPFFVNFTAGVTVGLSAKVAWAFPYTNDDTCDIEKLANFFSDATFDYQNSNITLKGTPSFSLSVGAGVRDALNVGLRGSISFPIYVGIIEGSLAGQGEYVPRVKVQFQGGFSVFLQIFLLKLTWNFAQFKPITWLDTYEDIVQKSSFKGGAAAEVASTLFKTTKNGSTSGLPSNTTFSELAFNKKDSTGFGAEGSTESDSVDMSRGFTLAEIAAMADENGEHVLMTGENAFAGVREATVSTASSVRNGGNIQQAGFARAAATASKIKFEMRDNGDGTCTLVRTVTSSSASPATFRTAAGSSGMPLVSEAGYIHTVDDDLGTEGEDGAGASGNAENTEGAGVSEDGGSYIFGDGNGNGDAAESDGVGGSGGADDADANNGDDAVTGAGEVELPDDWETKWAVSADAGYSIVGTRDALVNSGSETSSLTGLGESGVTANAAKILENVYSDGRPKFARVSSVNEDGSHVTRQAMFRIGSVKYDDVYHPRLLVQYKTDNGWTEAEPIDFAVAGAGLDGVSRADLHDYDFDVAEFTLKGNGETDERSYVAILLLSGVCTTNDTRSLSLESLATQPVSSLLILGKQFSPAATNVTGAGSNKTWTFEPTVRDAISWRTLASDTNTENYGNKKIMAYAPTISAVAANPDSSPNLSTVVISGAYLYRQTSSTAKNAVFDDSVVPESRLFTTSTSAFIYAPQGLPVSDLFCSTMELTGLDLSDDFDLSQGVLSLCAGPASFIQKWSTKWTALSYFGFTTGDGSGIFAIKHERSYEGNAFLIEDNFKCAHAAMSCMTARADIKRFTNWPKHQALVALVSAGSGDDERKEIHSVKLPMEYGKRVTEADFSQLGAEEDTPADFMISPNGELFLYGTSKEGQVVAEQDEDGNCVLDADGNVKCAEAEPVYSVMGMRAVTDTNGTTLLTKAFTVAEVATPVDSVVAASAASEATDIMFYHINSLQDSKADYYEVRIPCVASATPTSLGVVDDFATAGRECTFQLGLRNDGNTLLMGASVALLDADNGNKLLAEDLEIVFDESTVVDTTDAEPDAEVGETTTKQKFTTGYENFPDHPLGKSGGRTVIAPGRGARVNFIFEVPSDWSGKHNITVKTSKVRYADPITGEVYTTSTTGTAADGSTAFYSAASLSAAGGERTKVFGVQESDVSIGFDTLRAADGTTENLHGSREVVGVYNGDGGSSGGDGSNDSSGNGESGNAGSGSFGASGKSAKVGMPDTGDLMGMASLAAGTLGAGMLAYSKRRAQVAVEEAAAKAERAPSVDEPEED